MTNEANPIKDQSFRIDKQSYLLKNAEYLNSPNQDDRRDGQDPEIIVIHGISLPPGEYGGSYVSDLFLNSLDISVCEYFKEISTLKVSSHLFIDRLGRVTQFVPFNSRAWHAGESVYRGREMCNHFSIGIELEGQDNDEYSDIQYVCLAKTINALFEFYPSMSARDIVGHSDIAPKRKTDPGPAFNWKRLYTEIRSQSKNHD